MTVSSFVRTFFYSQLCVTPPKVTTSFAGQTVIITGGNVGLGLEAGKQIAALGCAKLILAVRTISKGEAAKATILKSIARSDDIIEVWPLDLSATESVQAFVARAKELERIDVLVENAGIALTYWKEFEGMEQNIKINVVSTLLIALHLLPKLRETAAKFGVTPHLVIVTSEALKLSGLPEAEGDLFANLADESYFNGRRYNTSKLMQLLFVRELVKHTQNVPVITAVTPGLTHSELANRSPSKLEHMSAQIFKFLLARKTEVGARTLLAGACAGPSAHGQYMEDSKVKPLDTLIAADKLDAVQKKTYEQTLAYLEKLEPGVSRNI